MKPIIPRRSFLVAGAAAAGWWATPARTWGSGPEGPSHNTGSGPSHHTCFTFQKTGALFDRPAGMPGPGPYYPCLVKMDGVKNFPFDYALYFSTDHDARGGIWLYLCSGAPSNPANWRSYDQAVAAGAFNHLAARPEKNPIFEDRVQGTHTETPHVNIIDGRAFMTYHNSTGDGQATMLATSADGVNFERLRGAADSAILPARGNGGHTGYFRWAENPFPAVPHRYVGYSLHGGGDRYHSAQWGSDDAISWRKLHVFTPREGLAMPHPLMIMIWHEINPNAVMPVGADEFVMLSAGGNRASGPAARVVELYEVFLRGDGRTFSRVSRKVLARGPAGSPDSEELAEPTVARIGDEWHLLYVGAGKRGRQNTVMAATGAFNPAAPLPARL